MATDIIDNSAGALVHDNAENGTPDTQTTLQAADDSGERDTPRASRRRAWSAQRLGLCTSALMVVVLAALTGWLGYRAHQSNQAQAQRAGYVDAARQAAVNLTTINFEHADADVQRILDSATGSFHDDFQARSQPFTDVVKKAQSTSEGSVTMAGLESVDGDTARVLVATSVKTTTAADPQPQPRAWRMRIDVLKAGNDMKVSNVEFVP